MHETPHLEPLSAVEDWLLIMEGFGWGWGRTKRWEGGGGLSQVLPLQKGGGELKKF